MECHFPLQLAMRETAMQLFWKKVSWFEVHTPTSPIDSYQIRGHSWKGKPTSQVGVTDKAFLPLFQTLVGSGPSMVSLPHHRSPFFHSTKRPRGATKRSSFSLSKSSLHVADLDMTSSIHWSEFACDSKIMMTSIATKSN